MGRLGGVLDQVHFPIADLLSMAFGMRYGWHEITLCHCENGLGLFKGIRATGSGWRSLCWEDTWCTRLKDNGNIRHGCQVCRFKILHV
jgi:hypothetical protein